MEKIVKNIQIHSHGEMLETVFRLPPNVCVLFTAKPGEASDGHPRVGPWAWIQIKDKSGVSGNLTADVGDGVDYHIDPPWFLSSGVNRGRWGNTGVPNELTRYKETNSVKDIGVSNHNGIIEYQKSLYEGGQLIQDHKYSMEQEYWEPKGVAGETRPQSTTQQLGIYDPTEEKHFVNLN